MRFAIFVHGTRGDVEPSLALACELRARGHQIILGIPPNLFANARALGFHSLIAYGPDSDQQSQSYFFRNLHSLWLRPWSFFKQARRYLTVCWSEMATTLFSHSQGVDYIITGSTYQHLALNVAEARCLPLATLHFFPFRANTTLLPFYIPISCVRVLFTLAEFAYGLLLRPADVSHRRSLGLSPTWSTISQRMLSHRSLEIQAYDHIFFPGIESQLGNHRPFVGSLTLATPSPNDLAVLEWISRGSPPIFIGFGSMSPLVTGSIIESIISYCLSQKLRVLLCGLDADALPTNINAYELLAVDSLCYQQIFPRCRLITHHGGSGTTGAALRAGIPSIILWVSADQPVWATAVQRLGVGASSCLHRLTIDRWRFLLGTALSAQVAERATKIKHQAIPADLAVSMSADLVEHHLHTYSRIDTLSMSAPF